MDIIHGDIEPHRRYLANVSEEMRARRLDKYRLKADSMQFVPFICVSDLINHKSAKWRRFMHPLDPISLDDLKNWFGVPNEAARLLRHRTVALNDGAPLWGGLTQVHVGKLPAQPGFDFSCLASEQRAAVLQMSKRLLYGYVAPDDAEQPAVAGVIRYMLELARQLKPLALVLSDLVVCPDDHVIFESVPLVVADNILIYGEGRISTRGNTRIDAMQIRHVDV